MARLDKSGHKIRSVRSTIRTSPSQYQSYFTDVKWGFTSRERTIPEQVPEEAIRDLVQRTENRCYSVATLVRHQQLLAKVKKRKLVWIAMWPRKTLCRRLSFKYLKDDRHHGGLSKYWLTNVKEWTDHLVQDLLIIAKDRRQRQWCSIYPYATPPHHPHSHPQWLEPFDRRMTGDWSRSQDLWIESRQRSLCLLKPHFIWIIYKHFKHL